jgi:hypothetical protein
MSLRDSGMTSKIRASLGVAVVESQATELFAMDGGSMAVVMLQATKAGTLPRAPGSPRSQTIAQLVRRASSFRVPRVNKCFHGAA